MRVGQLGSFRDKSLQMLTSRLCLCMGLLNLVVRLLRIRLQRIRIELGPSKRLDRGLQEIRATPALSERVRRSQDDREHGKGEHSSFHVA